MNSTTMAQSPLQKLVDEANGLFGSDTRLESLRYREVEPALGECDQDGAALQAAARPYDLFLLVGRNRGAVVPAPGDSYVAILRVLGNYSPVWGSARSRSLVMLLRDYDGTVIEHVFEASGRTLAALVKG